MCLLLQEAVETLVGTLGMQPCEGTEAVPPNARSHTVLMAGLFVGHQQVRGLQYSSQLAQTDCCGSRSLTLSCAQHIVTHGQRTCPITVSSTVGRCMVDAHDAWLMIDEHNASFTCQCMTVSRRHNMHHPVLAAPSGACAYELGDGRKWQCGNEAGCAWRFCRVIRSCALHYSERLSSS